MARLAAIRFLRRLRQGRAVRRRAARALWVAALLAAAATLYVWSTEPSDLSKPAIAASTTPDTVRSDTKPALPNKEAGLRSARAAMGCWPGLLRGHLALCTLAGNH